MYNVMFLPVESLLKMYMSLCCVIISFCYCSKATSNSVEVEKTLLLYESKCYDEFARNWQSLVKYWGPGINPECYITFPRVSANFDESGSCIGPNILSLYEIKKEETDRNITVHCNANYPLTFDFDGVLPYKSILVSKDIKYTYDGKMLYGIALQFPALRHATGKYTFSLINNIDLQTSIYIFVKGENLPFFLESGRHLLGTVNTTHIIFPCKAFYWNDTVKLYKMEINRPHDQLKMLSKVNYDSTVGFIMNYTSDGNITDIWGEYRCSIGRSIETDFVSVSVVRKEKDLNAVIQKSKEIGLTLEFHYGHNYSFIQCYASGVDKTHRKRNKINFFIVNVKASNPTESKLKREWLKKGIIEIANDTDDQEWIKSEECIKQSQCQLFGVFDSGLVLCSSSSMNASIEKEYYTDIRGYGEKHWINDLSKLTKENPQSLTMLYADSEQVYYAGVEYDFTCDSAYYVFVDSYIWYFHLRNASIIKAQDVNGTWPLRRGVSLYLSSEVVAIFCTSIFWNSNETLTSEPLNVTVKEKRKPRFSDDNIRPYVMRVMTSFENLSVTCSADGIPSPQMEWQRNGKLLPSSSTLTSEVNPEKVHIILQIEHFSKLDEGNYSCIANNIIGSAEKIFTLKFMGNQWNSDHENLAAAGYGAVAGISIGVIALAIVFIFLKYGQNERIGLSIEEIKEFENGITESGMYCESEYLNDNTEFKQYNKSFEVADADFEIVKPIIVLGTGAYGLVLKATFRGNIVATKTVKPHSDKMFLKALLSELKILIHLGTHPSIVNLLGANTASLRKGFAYIFVEYCSRGSLDKYMRKQRKSSNSEEEVNHDSRNNEHSHSGDFPNSRHLMSWSYQIAKGMEYLTEKKVIHGDLAARNILVFDETTVKITDFGLSIQLYEKMEYIRSQSEVLPWRWMAIESLTELTFSPQSDAWSFGVLLWEIFSVGDIPYPGLSWSIDFVQKLHENLRMLKPLHATEDMYHLMLKCWSINPIDRPSFADIAKYFREQLQTISAECYLNLEPDSETAQVYEEGASVCKIEVAVTSSLNENIEMKSTNT